MEDLFFVNPNLKVLKENDTFEVWFNKINDLVNNLYHISIAKDENDEDKKIEDTETKSVDISLPSILSIYTLLKDFIEHPEKYNVTKAYEQLIYLYRDMYRKLGTFYLLEKDGNDKIVTEEMYISYVPIDNVRNNGMHGETDILEVSPIQYLLKMHNNPDYDELTENKIEVSFAVVDTTKDITQLSDEEVKDKFNFVLFPTKEYLDYNFFNKTTTDVQNIHPETHFYDDINFGDDYDTGNNLYKIHTVSLPFDSGEKTSVLTLSSLESDQIEIYTHSIDLNNVPEYRDTRSDYNILDRIGGYIYTGNQNNVRIKGITTYAEHMYPDSCIVNYKDDNLYRNLEADSTKLNYGEPTTNIPASHYEVNKFYRDLCYEDFTFNGNISFNGNTYFNLGEHNHIYITALHNKDIITIKCTQTAKDQFITKLGQDFIYSTYHKNTVYLDAMNDTLVSPAHVPCITIQSRLRSNVISTVNFIGDVEYTLGALSFTPSTTKLSVAKINVTGNDSYQCPDDYEEALILTQNAVYSENTFSLSIGTENNYFTDLYITQLNVHSKNTDDVISLDFTLINDIVKKFKDIEKINKNLDLLDMLKGDLQNKYAYFVEGYQLGNKEHLTDIYAKNITFIKDDNKETILNYIGVYNLQKINDFFTFTINEELVGNVISHHKFEYTLPANTPIQLQWEYKPNTNSLVVVYNNTLLKQEEYNEISINEISLNFDCKREENDPENLLDVIKIETRRFTYKQTLEQELSVNTLIHLPFEYVPNTNSLIVFYDNKINTNYNEVSNTEISFNFKCEQGKEIYVINTNLINELEIAQKFNVTIKSNKLYANTLYIEDDSNFIEINSSYLNDITNNISDSLNRISILETKTESLAYNIQKVLNFINNSISYINNYVATEEDIKKILK